MNVRFPQGTYMRGGTTLQASSSSLQAFREERQRWYGCLRPKDKIEADDFAGHDVQARA